MKYTHTHTHTHTHTNTQTFHDTLTRAPSSFSKITPGDAFSPLRLGPIHTSVGTLGREDHTVSVTQLTLPKH